MLSIEQVQLLESRVAKAIQCVEKLSSENAALTSERALLQKKLDANQKRLDELEVLVMRFKEDQSRIEDGVIAALDRLSQFEEAFESSLKEKTAEKKTAVKTRAKPAEKSPSEEFFEISEKDAEKNSNLDVDLSDELDIF